MCFRKITALSSRTYACDLARDGMHILIPRTIERSACSPVFTLFCRAAVLDTRVPSCHCRAHVRAWPSRLHSAVMTGRRNVACAATAMTAQQAATRLSRLTGHPKLTRVMGPMVRRRSGAVNRGSLLAGLLRLPWRNDYYRRRAIKFEAGSLNSLAAISIASRSSDASTSPVQVCFGASV